MYRNARAAFELIDENLLYAAQTLGMPDRLIFWKVLLPAAGPGIASGTVLTFARALGEYGATSMLAGNIPGKTATISQRIAMVIQDQDYESAGLWVGIVLLIAFLSIFLLNRIAERSGRRRGSGELIEERRSPLPSLGKKRGGEEEEGEGQWSSR